MNLDVAVKIILICLLAILLKQYFDLKTHLANISQEASRNSTLKYSNARHPTYSSPQKRHSSYWCQGKTAHDRLCHFETLCFEPNEKQFIFFHDEKSIKEEPNKLSEGKFLTLSSIAHLHGNLFSIVDLPAGSFTQFQIDWFMETTLIYSRFKPDNLMHVLHDDILPMHHTLGFISREANHSAARRYPVRLFFTDDSEAGDNSKLYEAFSSYEILYKQSLKAQKNIMCFSDAYVGILKITTWYQYGFSKPQGPLADTSASSSHIHSTAEFIIHNSEPCGVCDDSKYLLFLSRKETRLILNERDLILELVNKLKIKVICISTETHNMADMIHLVRSSEGIIGMHGALMALTMFLPPKSILIELFPYAINPDNYTPYKTLAGIKGMGIVYKSWSNPDSTKSKGHPDRDELLGGIQHLPNEQQQEILLQQTVPSHLCCHDPSWLYHIYQDTEVDIHSVASLAAVAITEASNVLHRATENSLRPTTVTSLSCQMLQCQNKKAIVNLSWSGPWNVLYLPHEKLQYKILVQKQTSKGYYVFIVSKTHYTVTQNLECNMEYNIWVVASINETIDAPAAYIKCQT